MNTSTEKTAIQKDPVLWLTALFSLLLPIQYNSDTPFYYFHGNYILHHGFPYHAIGTWHKGLDFTIQNWLCSILLYLGRESIGEKLTMILWIKTANIILIIALYLTLSLITESKIKKLELAIFTFTLCMPYNTLTRSYIMTLAIIMIQLYVLERYKRLGDNKLWILPILSLLDINLEAALWPIFMVFFLPFILPKKIMEKIGENQNYDRMPILKIMGISILIAILNPYGIKQLFYLLEANDYTFFSTYTLECKAFHPVIIGITATTLVIIIVHVIIGIKNKQKLPMEEICLTIGTGIMALLMMRNLPFFGMAVSLYLAHITVKKYNRIIFIVITAMLTAVLIQYGRVMINIIKTHENEYMQNVALADWTKRFGENRKLKILNDFNNGTFLIDAGIKVYIDARAETYLKSKNHKANIAYEFVHADEDVRLKHDFKKLEKIMKKYHTNAYVGKEFRDYFYERNDYTILYENDEGIVAVKD